MNKRGKSLCGKKHLIVTRAFFTVFKKKNPNIEITYKDFTNIINSSNTIVKDFILSEQLGCSLPLDLGHLCVIKYKPSKSFIDKVTLRKTGKIVPLLNIHTFEYMYSIRYFNKTNSYSNPSSLYYLKPCRKLKKELSVSLQGIDYPNYLSLKTNHFFESKLSKKLLSYSKNTISWDL